MQCIRSDATSDVLFQETYEICCSKQQNKFYGIDDNIFTRRGVAGKRYLECTSIEVSEGSWNTPRVYTLFGNQVQLLIQLVLFEENTYIITYAEKVSKMEKFLEKRS